jgi:PAS domain S-box-containing protein
VKKNIRDELKESEELHKIIIKSISNGILAADVKTKRFVFANPRICEITGYSLKKLLRLGVADIHPKKDLPYVLNQFKKQLKGITLAKDIPVLRRDRKIVYCDVNSRVIKIGKQKLLIGFFRDITEHKKAEEDLRESVDRFKLLVENLPQLIFYKDVNSVYVYANTNYSKSVGLKNVRDIVGKTDFDFYPKNLAEKYRKDDKAVMESGKIKNIIEEWIERGERKIVHTVKTPVRSTDGKVIGVLAIFWDIIKERESEEKLKESEKKWISLTENTDDIVMVANSRGIIQYINKTIPPYTQEGTIGKTLYEYIPKEQYDIMWGSLKKVFKTGNPDNYEISSNIPKIGIIWFNTKVVPIKRDGKTVSVIMLSTNITERKRAEEELKKSRKELQAKVEEMERFNSLSVGRELKMVELKKRIKELAAKK